MKNPIIVVNGATEDQISYMYRSAHSLVGDILDDCKSLLCYGQNEGQYVVTFPNGVKNAFVLAKFFYEMGAAADAQNDADNSNISIQAFFYGCTLDGEVKPQGILNLVFDDYDVVVVDSSGNSYVEDFDLESELSEKSSLPEDQQLIFCVKPSTDIQNEYVDYPSWVETSNLRLVENEQFDAEEESVDEEKKQCFPSVNLASLKLIVLFIGICLLFLLNSFLSSSLDAPITFYEFVLFFVISILTAIFKPVPSEKTGFYARYINTLEKYFLYYMGSVLLISNILLALYKVFIK